MNYKKILILVFPLFLLAVGAFYYIRNLADNSGGEIMISAEADSLDAQLPVTLMYGIPVDSFIVQKGKIKRNQNLSDLIREFNLPEGGYNRLVTMKSDVFDLRKIRAGNDYTVFLTNDSLQVLKYFVYEHSPVEYILFDFTDSLDVSRNEKQITVVEKTFTGKIETSLWNAIIKQNANPMLAIELSEIYAWSIDFFGLQPEDSISVIYDEHYVDSIPIDLGRISVAYFKHAGAEFFAIPFTQDSIESYFDIEGNSLRKAFLKAPLRFSRISSRYSYSRLHPILKIRRPHLGVDYAAPAGTPVQAIGDGKIVKKEYTKGGGYMLKIKHNSIYTTAYLHLSGYGKGISLGSYVKQGDVIGFVGSTGLSTGPHLDFRFYKNGSPVDPLKVEAPPVEPVSETNWAAFDSIKAEALNRLKAI
ncbi:MAG: M23 family metallopeptidase [Bacteroidales bacterium]|nr:M23 family metallopeptidase [Bacteroidales bacterium]